MRRVSTLLFAVVAVVGMTVTGLALSAVAASANTTYEPEAPVVDTVSGGPWNTSQGDSSAGGAYAGADLLPSFAFGGAETTLGGVSEPNVAVYPGEQKVIENGKEVSELIPYPSGVAGTPGPLDGYCSSLGGNPEHGMPVSQPTGASLPFAPYYFPDVVRNADGSLTGYFDYRPKDADEAITVARSADGGKTWTSEGKALEQNPGYCPTADTNDDGQGHPYVASIGASTKLYTLNRPSGDYEGVGLLVHNVEPAAANPLGALPASEPVGIDPNTYAAEEVEVPISGGISIPVSTLGTEGSPEHIVPGPYEDYNAASPAKTIITCAGTSKSPLALTGCTVAGSSTLIVKGGNDLVQVIATANPEEVGGKKPEKGAVYTIPAGPNKPNGAGGLAKLSFLNGNATVSPLTTFILNEDAPNRVYIDGDTVYCVQANANPTTKIEDCTNTSGSALTVHQGDAITADPILPPSATVTTGLKAPDGIVGTLPHYPGAPAGTTVVLYTEKVLAYFVVGTIDGSVSGSTYTAGAVSLPASTITYTPSVHESEQLPSSGSFKIYLGTEVGEPIQEVTCGGSSAATQAGVPAGSFNLTECSGGTGSVAEGNWVGGPHAAIAPVSALEQIGEGKNTSAKGPEKLFGNNEDLTVLRAAYTENGVNFTDLGAISGSTSGTGNDSGSYNDISNPEQQTSPSNTSPTNLAPGQEDTTQLRFVGSRGTIITNPDGSYGMFLSGAWATDGDSDAFNQIFYSTSTNGTEWSVPKVVVSTDYTFAASAKQDEELGKGEDTALEVSGYYSGRAYGPSVVQNANDSLTMVFSGYRLPKPLEKAGTVLGTNPLKRYKIGAKDPALYRNILTLQLNASTSPGVTTSTSVSSSDEGKGLSGTPVTYTATVAPVAPGSGTPTGTVSFSDSSGPISGCSAQPLDLDSPDIATCATEHSDAGTDEITAEYHGDSNYSGSSGILTETSLEAPAITSGEVATFVEGSNGSFTVSATGTPSPSISETGTLPNGVTFNTSTDTLSGTPTEAGTYTISFTAANGVGANATQTFTLTVNAPPAITSNDAATFTEGSEGSFTVTATGTPVPTITETGALPQGVALKGGVLVGTPTQEGIYHVKLTATNEVGFSSQSFTLTVDSVPAFTSPDEATFSQNTPGILKISATSTPTPTITESGALPAGVTFSNGLLSGTTSEVGSFDVEFIAHNTVGTSVQQFTLTVLGLHVASTSLPKLNLGSYYGRQLEAEGGTRPYTWKMTAGSLPHGLKLRRSGLISGTVKTKADPDGNPYTFTVTVTDHAKPVHQTASHTFTLDVS